jgi:hypothetical protein
VNDYSKARFMEYVRNIDKTFAENLKYSISWKVDFIERICYGIKGDAKRDFICEFFMISIDKN